MSHPRFSIIPADAVTDRRLEPRDLQILCLLGRHTDNRGWCCRSQVKMAKELIIGRATVKRSIDRLVSAGYLEHRPKQRESGGDAAHDYRVIIDVAENTDSAKLPAQEVPTHGQGVPTLDGQGVPTLDGQGVPTLDGQGVPTYERAPMLTTPVKRTPAKRNERERACEEFDDFEKARTEWPTGFADSREQAHTAWTALSLEDRAEAVAAIGRFVTASRAMGRKHLCTFGTYLAERRWQALPERGKKSGMTDRGDGQARAPRCETKTEAAVRRFMARGDDDEELVRPRLKPTAFQLANPHLYPELFAKADGASADASS